MALDANIQFASYTLEEANKVAQTLQIKDKQWDYRVIDLKNGQGRIDVYNEDGVLVFTDAYF